MVNIKVFGEKESLLSKKILKKVRLLLNEWKIENQLGLFFYDVATVEGLAEGAYYEVDELPTVIILSTEEIVRWKGIVPEIEDMKRYIEEM